MRQIVRKQGTLKIRKIRENQKMENQGKSENGKSGKSENG